jgi:hypothetical protein
MARLTRVIVVISTLLAVAVGLWPLQTQPELAAALSSTFLGAALLGRFLPAVATALVLAAAYVSYGVVRLIAGPAIAGMPFFLAAFAGLALGTAPWTRWMARPPWRGPLAWWGTGVALTWPYVAARELNFSLDPSMAAGPIVTTAALQMSLALWMDRLLRERDHAASFHDDDLPLGPWHQPLMLSALGTAGVAMYQRWADLSWLSGDPWSTLGRSTGMMGDANPMGFATALWAPITVSAFATSVGSTLVGGLLSVPLWIGAWVSGARTTLILFAAGGAALLLLLTTARGWPRRVVIVAAAGVAAVLLAVALWLAPRAESSTPLGRLLALAPKSSLGDAAYELLWNRDGYGTAAIAAINEHPLMGVGIGRFTPLSTGYAQRALGRTIPPDNAQNLWRHTLAEQGLVGFLPILWLTVLTVLAVVSGRAEGMGLVLRVMVAGMGCGLMFGYPVQDPAIAVTLATMIAAVARQR